VNKSVGKKSSATSGLTLIEVLIALGLIGVAGAMFGYFVSSLQTTQKARQQTGAVAYAREYLDGLRAKWQTLEGYQNLSLAVPVNAPESYDLEVRIENAEGGALYTYPGGAGGEDLSTLRKITLTFTDEQDKPVSLITTIARPTPVPTEAEE
jgi:prepilin-type N-terminal cleavage/methylation domain-containing protein